MLDAHASVRLGKQIIASACNCTFVGLLVLSNPPHLSLISKLCLVATRFSNVDCVAFVKLYNKGPLALKEKHPTPRLQSPPFLADYGFIFQQTLSICDEHFR